MYRNHVRVWLASFAMMIPAVGLSGSSQAGHAPWESWDRDTGACLQRCGGSSGKRRDV
jgi:hypothetical protein